MAKAALAKATPPKTMAKGRVLGKGLSALMAENYGHMEAEREIVANVQNALARHEATEQGAGQTTAEEKAGQAMEQPARTLPLSALRPGQFQPRRNFESAALAELTESIRKNGVMQPVLVRPLAEGKYEIIAGERRWRASQMAGLDTIPVLIREMENEVALELALVENIQRKDLNPLEEAAGYQRLMDDFGYTQEMLAGAVHKSRSHIANLLRLLALPEEVRGLLTEDKLSMGHARALMNTPNPLELANEVIRKGLNVRQTEKLANNEKNPTARKPRTPKNTSAIPGSEHSVAPALQLVTPNPKDPDILALEATLSENLGLKVAISDRGQSGEIIIAYESLEQLDEILRRLGGSI